MVALLNGLKIPIYFSMHIFRPHILYLSLKRVGGAIFRPKLEIFQLYCISDYHVIVGAFGFTFYRSRQSAWYASQSLFRTILYLLISCRFVTLTTIFVVFRVFPAFFGFQAPARHHQRAEAPAHHKVQRQFPNLCAHTHATPQSRSNDGEKKPQSFMLSAHLLLIPRFGKIICFFIEPQSDQERELCTIRVFMRIFPFLQVRLRGFLHGTWWNV